MSRLLVTHVLSNTVFDNRFTSAFLDIDGQLEAQNPQEEQSHDEYREQQGGPTGKTLNQTTVTFSELLILATQLSNLELTQRL
jgi:hypothetical protein